MSRPVLTTERLRLEPLTAEHTDVVATIDADPEVMRFLTGHERPRDEVVEQWLPHMTDPVLDARGLGYWVGYAEEEPVGWWCLTRRGDTHDEEPATGWLGYRLLRTAWGRGTPRRGGRAARARLRHLGLERVRAETMAVNTRSRAVLDARHAPGADLGRQWEDPLPGWERGEVVYLLTDGDWRLR